jgi:hypothetical protein
MCLNDAFVSVHVAFCTAWSTVLDTTVTVHLAKNFLVFDGTHRCIIVFTTISHVSLLVIKLFQSTPSRSYTFLTLSNIILLYMYLSSKWAHSFRICYRKLYIFFSFLCILRVCLIVNLMTLKYLVSGIYSRTRLKRHERD